AILAVDLPVDELGEGAYADQVDIARQHTRDFGDVLLGLAIHHRAELELDRPRILARRQHDGGAAELGGTQLEAGARSQRGIEEQQGDRLALQLIANLVALELSGMRKQGIEFGAVQSWVLRKCFIGAVIGDSLESRELG